MRTIDLGQSFMGHFPLFEADGVTKRSGVLTFVPSLWFNGGPSGVPVSVSEIGSSGEYVASFTPTAAGWWGLEVYAPATGERWGEDCTVVVADLEWGFSAADDNVTAEFSIWLERAGQRQVDITSVAAVVRDGDGVEVVDLGTDASPTAEGVFTFTCASSSLPGAAEYHVDVRATRGLAAWYSNLGFTKV